MYYVNPNWSSHIRLRCAKFCHGQIWHSGKKFKLAACQIICAKVANFGNNCVIIEVTKKTHARNMSL